MNHVFHQFTRQTPRILKLTALAAVIAMASAANAATSDLTMAPAMGSTAAPAQATNHKVSRQITKEENVETRIAELHDKLGITPAQEDAWKNVAAVMRDNSDKITALVKARAENATTMTAVDDLNSYAEIAGAHEEGTKKLVPVFKALYDGMPEAQQKAADSVFRGKTGHAVAHHVSSNPAS